MYRPVDRETKRRYNQTFKAKHRDKVLAASKRYYQKHKDLVSLNVCYYNMVSRCENPEHAHYERYGGRGITVCERWLGEDGRKNFLSDMGEKPFGYSIERIDNMLGYSPSNCKWATQKEQQRNKRNSISVEFEGKIMNLAEAAEVTGILYDTLRFRYLNGEVGEELFRPTPKMKKQKILQQEELSHWEHHHRQHQTHMQFRLPRLNRMLQLLVRTLS